MPLEEIASRLVTALLLGAAIGVERQWRQRSAGLRTNALVALGAATFALLGLSIAGESSPTRMAAQVASGIGFIGAGAILRQGLDVKGLNTAATLWCSAAMGVACGAGLYLVAVLSGLLVVLVNMVLRPIVAAIDHAPQSGSEIERRWCISATVAAEAEATIRMLLLKQIAASDARLQQLETEHLPSPQGEDRRVALTAWLAAGGQAAETLEGIVGRLSLEPAVSRAGWSAETESV